MTCVVDASFVASLFLPDETSDIATALSTELVKGQAAAPALMQLEVTNILLVASRRKRISNAQSKQLSEAFDHLPIVYHASLTTGQRAEVLRLAATHILTAYDAAYLELASRLGVALLTCDKSLIRAAATESVAIPSALR